MLIVIGLIAVLSTIVLLAVNPGRQFKIAHDTERKAHLIAILNAIGQNISEHSGKLTCNERAFTLPSVYATIESGDVSVGDLGSCLVPTYLPKMPYDPTLPDAFFNSSTDFFTGYEIRMDDDGYIMLSAESEASSTQRIEVAR